jgi:hypothetical protein
VAEKFEFNGRLHLALSEGRKRGRRKIGKTGEVQAKGGKK